MNRNIRQYLADGTEILLESEYNELKRRCIGLSFEEKRAMMTYRKYWALYGQTLISIGNVHFNLKDKHDLNIVRNYVNRTI